MNIQSLPQSLSQAISQAGPAFIASNQASRAVKPAFSACPLCAAAVGSVAATGVVSYLAGKQVSGEQIAVAGGVSTLAGSALGGLLFATHLLEPFNLIGSALVGMATSTLSALAILRSQKNKQ